MEGDEDQCENGEENVKLTDRSFERRFLGTKKEKRTLVEDGGAREDQGERSEVSEFEKSLSYRKNLMLQEIHYDTQRLEKTEENLRSVSDIMNLFTQKVVEQGAMTEQGKN